uniref:Uncharacterized protein n=1 Tax=Arundo donax TaxID=35708 RepID=A0A0A9B8S5_ARUDO
MCLLLVVC